MEKSIKDLSKEQGYEYVCKNDIENGIWGYAKDGKFHFCLENLTEVNRNVLCDNSELMVIDTDFFPAIVKNGDTFYEGFIIDSSNNILAKVYSQGNGFGHLYQTNVIEHLYLTNGKCSVIMKVKREPFVKIKRTDIFPEIKPCLEKNYRIKSQSKDQIVIIDEKIEPQYRLSRVIGDTIFILDCDNQSMIHNGKECVVLPDYSYIWKHEDGTIHFLNYLHEGEKHIMNYTTVTKETISIGTIEIPICTQDLLDFESNNLLWSDNYIIVPIYKNDDPLKIHLGDRNIIINYNTSNICVYPISFNREDAYNTSFTNNIIIKEYGSYDCDFNLEEIGLYDVRGNQLELSYTPVEKLNKNNTFHVIFSQKSNGLINKIERLYGILRLKRSWAKIVVPPIFEKIEELSSNLYKVRLANYVDENCHQFEGLYSISEGFIQAEAVRLEHCNYIEGDCLMANAPEGLVAFLKQGKRGLIKNGKIVIDATLDDICGFDFSDKYIGERIKEGTIEEIKKKTRAYSPKSVVLKDKGKYGLYFDDDHIIMPIYDSIRCILITKENPYYDDFEDSITYDKFAYFKVTQGNKVGFISDNIDFNTNSKVEYDDIEVEKRFRNYAVIKVYKNGNVGLRTTIKKRENKGFFSIPVDYNTLNIRMVKTIQGELMACLYEADGYFINKDGHHLLETEGYDYIGYCSYNGCLAFRSKENGEYLFLYSYGSPFPIIGRDKYGNIKLSDNCTFNITSEKFILKRNEFSNQRYYTPSSDEYNDYSQDELNDMYRDAFDGNPEYESNID